MFNNSSYLDSGYQTMQRKQTQTSHSPVMCLPMNSILTIYSDKIKKRLNLKRFSNYIDVTFLYLTRALNNKKQNNNYFKNIACSVITN